MHVHGDHAGSLESRGLFSYVERVALAAKKKTPRMTRREVARALGVTLTRVRHLEQHGKLHPVADESGRFTFDRAEVSAYVRTRPARRQVDGEIASRVFRMISEGFPLRDIVIETCLSPDTVRKLHDEYRRPFVPVDESILEQMDKSAAELDKRIAAQQRRGGPRA